MAEVKSSVIDAAVPVTLHRLVREKNRGEAICASLLPQLRIGAVLPVAELRVDSIIRVALIDSGCSRCIVYEPCCASWERKNVSVVTVNGQKQNCEGIGRVCLQVGDGESVEVYVFVTSFKPFGFECILGVNGIKSLGGATMPSLDVHFGPLVTEDRESFGIQELVCVAVMEVDKPDFHAVYDDNEKAWTVAWKWAGNSEPDALRHTVAEYAVASSAQAEYEGEIMNGSQMGG